MGITFDHAPRLRLRTHGRWATEIRPAPKAAPYKGARVEILHTGQRGTFQAVLRLSGNKWEVKLDDNQIAWILLKDIRVIRGRLSRLWRWVCRRNDTPQSTVSPSLQKERLARVAAPIKDNQAKDRSRKSSSKSSTWIPFSSFSW